MKVFKLPFTTRKTSDAIVTNKIISVFPIPQRRELMLLSLDFSDQNGRQFTLIRDCFDNDPTYEKKMYTNGNKVKELNC